MDSIARNTIVNIIEHDEGGWVGFNNANDPDTFTYAGLRLELVAKHLNKPNLTIEEFHNFSRDTIIGLYHSMYYMPYRVADVALYTSEDLYFAQAFMSFGINSGFDDAIKVLQKVINSADQTQLKIDGVIGPKTIQALQFAVFKLGVRTMRKLFVIGWLLFYSDLVIKNVDGLLAKTSQIKRYKNLNGWTKRATYYFP